MNTTRYNIIATNKCGSTVLHKILRNILEEIPEKTVVTIGGVEYMFSRTTDYVDDENYINTEGVYNKFICIPRNPISMSISMFYSYAYTHGRNKNQTLEQYEEQRLSKQEMGLEKFVEKALGRNSRKIKRIFESKVDKTIIPYELMVSNFELFLQQFLDSLNMLDRYEEAYARWKDDFKPIQDKSEDIVSGDYSGHRRTTDINEWKEKFDEETINRYIKIYPMIVEYEEYLKSLNIN
jgi:hypothetical protein